MGLPLIVMLLVGGTLRAVMRQEERTDDPFTADPAS